ncbi:LOW QUALITY PROTEIN: uncharacterized protein WCC33_013419 [Rhinophrynus dorsalis]
MEWCADHWPDWWIEEGLTRNLVFLELFLIVVAVELWRSSLREQRVVFHCDNLGVVEVINNLSASSLPVLRLLRFLVLACLNLNVSFRAVNVPGVPNVVADALSRFQMAAFRVAWPKAKLTGVIAASCIGKAGRISVWRDVTKEFVVCMALKGFRKESQQQDCRRPVSFSLLHQLMQVLPQPHCFKSPSHLMSLSLLLLLDAGDISPNPGPPSILSCTAKPTHTCNIHNLIAVPSPNLLPPPFCFGLWNSRYVCNKLTAVHDLFISHSLNLLAITETWLTLSDTASTAALSHGGLQFTHTPRPGNRQGGGVGILLSPNHIFQVLSTAPSLYFPTFEVHTLHLFSPFPLRVAVIYRSPCPTTQFLDHFTSWLPHFMSSDVPTLIMGDFNIPIDNHNTPPRPQTPLLNNLLWLNTVDQLPHAQ